uniref:Peptidase M12B propeptide domain-containing protein n=1 Tax=Accipiter nisus TaxID=211598 RepID=A0A8B9RZM2_9AVES
PQPAAPRRRPQMDYLRLVLSCLVPLHGCLAAGGAPAPAGLAKELPESGRPPKCWRAGCSVPVVEPFSLRLVSAELLLSGKLSEYGVIVPFSADCRGRFLSHVSPRRRGAGGRLLYFNVTVFGKELHLRLRPNRRLVPAGAVAEWQEDFEVLFREPLQQRCLFTGDISGMPGAAVAISNCDGLVSSSRNFFLCVSHLFNEAE